MVYDSSRGKTVLFGGQIDLEWISNVEDNGFIYLGDTWEWDGISWVKMAEEDDNGVLAPTPRAYHTMTYDASREVTLLFGGNGVGGGVGGGNLGDTWEWVARAWQASTWRLLRKRLAQNSPVKTKG